MKEPKGMIAQIPKTRFIRSVCNEASECSEMLRDCAANGLHGKNALVIPSMIFRHSNAKLYTHAKHG